MAYFMDVDSPIRKRKRAPTPSPTDSTAEPPACRYAGRSGAKRFPAIARIVRQSPSQRDAVRTAIAETEASAARGDRERSRIVGLLRGIKFFGEVLVGGYWQLLRASASVAAVDTDASGRKRRAVEIETLPADYQPAVPGAFPVSPVRLAPPPPAPMSRSSSDSSSGVPATKRGTILTPPASRPGSPAGLAPSKSTKPAMAPPNAPRREQGIRRLPPPTGGKLPPRPKEPLTGDENVDALIEKLNKSFHGSTTDIPEVQAPKQEYRGYKLDEIRGLTDRDIRLNREENEVEEYYRAKDERALERWRVKRARQDKLLAKQAEESKKRAQAEAEEAARQIEKEAKEAAVRAQEAAKKAQEAAAAQAKNKKPGRKDSVEKSHLTEVARRRIERANALGISEEDYRYIEDAIVKGYQVDPEQIVKDAKALDTSIVNALASAEQDIEIRIRDSGRLRDPRWDQKQPLIRPLDPEWSQKVDHVMDIKNRDSVITKTVDGADIKRSDLGSLVTPAESNGHNSPWLNDEIVNGIISAIVSRKLEKTGYVKAQHVPTYASYPSMWYTNVQKKGIKGIETWSKRKGIKGVKLLECSRIFFPVNTGAHWMLLVISPILKRIEFLDSLATGGKRHEEMFALARDWLQMELGKDYDPDEWTEMRDHHSARQTNSDDCGVFACFNALASAKNLPYQDVGIGSMIDARRILAAVLINEGFKGDFEL